MFLLLINNISVIAVSESEKVIRNARHIDIYYHHIQNLIEKKIIEISHISTDEITADNFTKTLLSNKFKKFIELIRISKIETDSKFNNNKTSNDKNDENFVTNYYEEADKEVSFKTEEAK